jgi:peptidoglycan/xylan/chitin deacetylase (PgdA/CDA1 family)
MNIIRIIRNAFCWLLAVVLIRLDSAKRAKQESFQDGTIISVNFHNPNKNLFKRITTWFRDNGYTIISCDQLIDIINKRTTCPRGAVWISLDDGWKGNIDNVIPVAVEDNIPVTIFIYTDATENGSFWWKRVQTYPRLLPAELRRTRALRKLPDEQRKRLLNQLNQLVPPGSFKREAMTIDDIRYISSLPQVTIGSHTVSHPILTNCTGSVVDYELGESKKKLEDWTGKPVKIFAYPNGAYSGNERESLEKHGYELAATAEGRFANPDDNCYLFPRSDIMDDGTLTENLCHALGVWEPVIKRFKRIIKPGS